MNALGLLVMAKAPIAGRVKTRLCPPCTPDEAAAIAEAALCDTLNAALSCERPVVLALAGSPGSWLPPDVHLVAQTHGTFNERLAAAWTHLPHGGIQIGMDTPQVEPYLLDRAFDAVAEFGAVLGPATDGGWWLLGLDRLEQSLFDGIVMSTATTGEQQQRRLRQLGFEPQLLSELTDIDTWPTACEVAATIPRSRTALAISRVADRVGAKYG